MKKFPIGIQTFSEIRSENHIYIDKTKMVFDLIENGKYYFLSKAILKYIGLSYSQAVNCF